MALLFVLVWSIHRKHNGQTTRQMLDVTALQDERLREKAINDVVGCGSPQYDFHK